MFVVRDGAGHTVLVNEIAPRVHNSGHWTIDGCSVSQFEQHIRAVVGWPLAEPVLPRPRRDDQPDRRRGLGLSPVARDARRLRAPLRQAGDPPRPQDGPRDPRVSARLTGASPPYAHRRSTARAGFTRTPRRIGCRRNGRNQHVERVRSSRQPPPVSAVHRRQHRAHLRRQARLRRDAAAEVEAARSDGVGAARSREPHQVAERGDQRVRLRAGDAPERAARPFRLHGVRHRRRGDAARQPRSLPQIPAAAAPPRRRQQGRHVDRTFSARNIPRRSSSRRPAATRPTTSTARKASPRPPSPATT